MAAREALAAGLVQQREASREPLGALPGGAPRGAPPPPALALHEAVEALEAALAIAQQLQLQTPPTLRRWKKRSKRLSPKIQSSTS